MKYPLSLSILISIFFLGLNCDPDKLKPPKGKDSTLADENSTLLYILRKQDKCLDENWEAGHVELYVDGVRVCGGLQKNNYNIYTSSKQRITEKIITTKQDLWCTLINDEGLITTKNQDIYSWFRVTKKSPLTGEFIMKHTLQTDMSGVIIGMDNFNQYSHGEELLCCSLLTNYYCEKIKYE